MNSTSIKQAIMPYLREVVIILLIVGFLFFFEGCPNPAKTVFGEEGFLEDKPSRLTFETFKKAKKKQKEFADQKPKPTPEELTDLANKTATWLFDLADFAQEFPENPTPEELKEQLNLLNKLESAYEELGVSRKKVKLEFGGNAQEQERVYEQLKQIQLWLEHANNNALDIWKKFLDYELTEKSDCNSSRFENYRTHIEEHMDSGPESTTPLPHLRDFLAGNVKRFQADRMEILKKFKKPPDFERSSREDFLSYAKDKKLPEILRWKARELWINNLKLNDADLDKLEIHLSELKAKAKSEDEKYFPVKELIRSRRKFLSDVNSSIFEFLHNPRSNNSFDELPLPLVEDEQATKLRKHLKDFGKEWTAGENLERNSSGDYPSELGKIVEAWGDANRSIRFAELEEKALRRREYALRINETLTENNIEELDEIEKHEQAAPMVKKARQWLEDQKKLKDALGAVDEWLKAEIPEEMNATETRDDFIKAANSGYDPKWEQDFKKHDHVIKRIKELLDLKYGADDSKGKKWRKDLSAGKVEDEHFERWHLVEPLKNELGAFPNLSGSIDMAREESVSLGKALSFQNEKNWEDAIAEFNKCPRWSVLGSLFRDASLKRLKHITTAHEYTVIIPKDEEEKLTFTFDDSVDPPFHRFPWLFWVWPDPDFDLIIKINGKPQWSNLAAPGEIENIDGKAVANFDGINDDNITFEWKAPQEIGLEFDANLSNYEMVKFKGPDAIKKLADRFGKDEDIRKIFSGFPYPWPKKTDVVTPKPPGPETINQALEDAHKLNN